MKISLRAAIVLLCVVSILVTCVVSVAILVSSNNSTIDSTKEAGADGMNQCLTGSEVSINDLTGKLLRRVVGQVSLQLEAVVEAPHRHATELQSFLSSFDADTVTDPAFARDIIKRNMFSKLKATADYGVSMLALMLEPTSPKGVTEGHRLPPDGDGMWGGITVVNMEGTGSEPSFYCGSTFDPNGNFYGLDAKWLGFGSIIDAAGNIDDTVPCRDILGGKQTTGLCRLPASYIFSSGINDTLTRLDSQTKNVIHNSPALPTVSHVTLFTYVELSDPVMQSASNKLGILVVGIRLEQLASIFSSINASIPLNAVVYGVEQNPWTGEVATLLGTNVGNTVAYNDSGIGSAEAPRIQNFAHFVVSAHYEEVTKRGGYSGIAGDLKNLTVEGEPYFAMVGEVTFNEFVWYVSLVVPRVSMMGVIDAVTDEIEANFDASNSKVDSDRRRTFATAIAAVCSVAISAAVVCGFAATTIISDLLELEKEMTAVANMKLEEVSNKWSHYAEVGRMQEAFRKMVLNLVEYRNFMPQSVLCDTSDGDDDATGRDDTLSMSGRSNLDSSTVLSGSMSMSIAPRVDKETTYVSALKQHLDLKKKNVSFVVFNVCDFHNTTRTMSSSDCQVYHAEIMQQLLLAISAFKGMPDTFSGDRLLATYNALRQVSTHRSAACSTMGYLVANLRRALITQSTAMSAGITCGEARVGNMGCQGMKKYTLLSEHLTWCYGLERFARQKLSKGCLVDESIQGEAELTHECCLVGGLTFSKIHPSRTQFVYKLGDAKTLKDEEWMYQVEEARSNSTFAAWNAALKFALKRDWAEAKRQMERVSPMQVGELKEIVDIKDWIAKEVIHIPTLTYH